MTPNTCTLRTSAILQGFTSGINYQKLFIRENSKTENAYLARFLLKFKIFTSPPPEFESKRSLTKIFPKSGIIFVNPGEVKA